MASKRTTGKSRNLSPHNIEQNPENPRLIFRQDEMDNLMFSIDRHGIQVPLTVYQDGDVFRLIDGERRWRCARKLNMSTVPVLVQDKPTELENLLLMYNIHALREQWDYFTIASKLTRVIDLYAREHGYKPNEVQLSEETGLTRGQIRRCRLLIELPERFKDMLLHELALPKLQQKLSEDLFIEMERSLKTVTNRLPEYVERIDDTRDALVSKFRQGLIPAVTDFRQLSKIATAVDNISLPRAAAVRSLDAVFDPTSDKGIREAYVQTVEFGYDEKDAIRRLQSLIGFLDRILEMHRVDTLDEDFLDHARELHGKLTRILGS
ncbi:MAG: ParB/RepB/Spo0J family partition protein [Acidobacteria bacterium]|nr:ParB/RepB/Spo0J family partition protein [Acidobacteriota bacterium]MYK78408.1 ParB/RepB/Spo0J family partition protein [Acidobacteriota bacterium]